MTAHHRPNLRPVGVAMVVHGVPGAERHLDDEALLPHVQNAKTAPGLLSKHGRPGKPFHIRLNIAGTALIRHQNPLGAGRHHGISHPQAENRHVHLIDDLGAAAALVHGHIADGRYLHNFRQRVPRPQILPRSGVAQDRKVRLLFHHGVIEADGIDRFVLRQKRLIARNPQQRPGLL